MMKKKKIKRGAHAVTSLAVCWTLFSAFGVFDWIDARRYIGGPDYLINFTIWGIHVFLIGLALYAWQREKPGETLWIGDDDEILDVKPEDINLEEEKVKLRSSIRLTIIGTVWIIGFAWVSMYFSGKAQSQASLPGILVFFGGLMILNITGSVIKYFILQRKAKKAQNKSR